MQKLEKLKFLFLPLTMFLYYLIAYQLKRTDFNIIFISISIQFLIYYWCFKNLTFNWWLPICLRLIFIIAIPNLSDDFYRFIYDGRLVASGQNPYLYLPSQLPVNELFKFINSPNYFSVYPPINQLLFFLGSYFLSNNILGNIIVLRVIIIFFEIGNIYIIGRLLKLFELPNSNIWLYALNPLIIIELTGNLHFEGVMLFFILAAFWYLQKTFDSNKYLAFSAVILSIAVSIKIIPIMFLPFIIRKIGWQKGFFYVSVVAIFNIIYFLPFYNIQVFINISKSLNLYFQSFEFNASIYYLLSWLGNIITGYNQIYIIGPILKIITALILVLIFFKIKNKKSYNDKSFDLIKTTITYKNDLNDTLIYCQIALTIYFLLATTVHPWYLVTLIGISSFTILKYPFFWSYLIFLSYSAYISIPIQENFWLVSVEYFLLLVMLYFEKNKYLDLFKRNN